MCIKDFSSLMLSNLGGILFGFQLALVPSRSTCWFNLRSRTTTERSKMEEVAEATKKSEYELKSEEKLSPRSP